MSIVCASAEGKFGVSFSLQRGAPSSVLAFGRRQWKPDKVYRDGMTLVGVRQMARPMTFLRLDEARLAEPHYSEITPPRIERDGKGLASVLAYMSLNAPDVFDDFQSHMRELIPRLDRIRFDKAEVRQQVSEEIQIDPNTKIEKISTRRYQGDKLLFDFVGAKDVAAHAVSEGTLVLLGILAVLLGPVRPKVLLLDDIERGLHPAAQHKLLDTLKALMLRFSDLQILATAHSPYLLDRLPPEQVRIMSIDEQGHSICGRLSDHPQFERWKDEMAAGEMWSLFGERWLAEGAAAK
jgi:predicted ATPase